MVYNNYTNDMMFKRTSIDDLINSVSNIILQLRQLGYSESNIQEIIDEAVVACGWLREDFDREVMRINEEYTLKFNAEKNITN